MKPQIGFFSELQGPSLIINLAQLVSPSVALPAQLVFPFFLVLNFCPALWASRSVGVPLGSEKY